MYKIGLIGHSIDHYSDCAKIRSELEKTMDLLFRQYRGPNLAREYSAFENPIYNGVSFNIVGQTGVGLWAGKIALEKNYKYNLYLPSSPEKTSEHWYDYQKAELSELCNRAYSITLGYSEDFYTLLADDSNFIVAFWIGKKLGMTYDTIKYALKSNKLAIHGLDELKLITNSSI